VLVREMVHYGTIRIEDGRLVFTPRVCARELSFWRFILLCLEVPAGPSGPVFAGSMLLS
jgi:hypothetical protein